VTVKRWVPILSLEQMKLYLFKFGAHRVGLSSIFVQHDVYDLLYKPSSLH